MDGGMSIAMVTETYPPEINGVALTVDQTVRHLRCRGHRVRLVRPRQAGDDGGADALLVRGLPLPRYPGLQFGLPAPMTLMRAWRAERPDIVHIVTEGPLGWSALFAARQLGIPVTTDYRTRFDQYSGFYRLGVLSGTISGALRAFHNRSDLTFVPTRSLVQELSRAGYRELACVGRGVDADLFSPRRRSTDLRSMWGAGDAQLVAMHVGRLAPEKDPLLVRAAFRAIRTQVPDARLVWVGDGPMREELERDAEGEIFVGLRRGDELAEHFASADLFLFPSRSETFGNVVLEAMASGLPIVAYALGAAQEHLGTHPAACVVPLGGGARAFVESARNLASRPEVRKYLGAIAREAARELSWPRVIGGFETHLAECALRRSPAANVATAA